MHQSLLIIDIIIFSYRYGSPGECDSSELDLLTAAFALVYSAHLLFTSLGGIQVGDSRLQTS